MATHSAVPRGFVLGGAAAVVDGAADAEVAGALGWGAAAAAGAETDDPVLADVEGGRGGVTDAFFFAFDIANTKRSACPMGIFTILAMSLNCGSVLDRRKLRSS